MPEDTAPEPYRLSPARAHLQRMAALQSGVPAQPGATGAEHELLMAQLYEHTKQLKSIKSVEKKIEAKREFVPVYDAYLDGVLSAGPGGADPIVTSLLVWNIDAGRYDRAFDLAIYALKHKLQLPDQYHRDVPTLLADEFSTAALSGAMPADQQPSHLGRVLVITEGCDMPDQARAKLHKAIGYALIGKHGSADPDLDTIDDITARFAERHLSRALALNPQVGVKKDLERLARRLKDAPPASDPADPRPGGPVGDGTGAPAPTA